MVRQATRPYAKRLAPLATDTDVPETAMGSCRHLRFSPGARERLPGNDQLVFGAPFVAAPDHAAAQVDDRAEDVDGLGVEGRGR